MARMKEYMQSLSEFVKRSKFFKGFFFITIIPINSLLVYSMQPSKGVIIEDMGVKFECNGVDNGM
jgi:hypothetical protein